MRQYLNNYRNNLRAKAAANEAIPVAAGPAPDADADMGDDGDQGDDSSDVNVSDIDD